MVRLQEKYQQHVINSLTQDFGIKNVMAVPSLQKVVVHMSLGKVNGNREELQRAVEDLTAITGQKPIVTVAKKAISGFKLRQGDKIGVKVTLRGARMWEFLDKLFSIVLPRTRDFQGLPHTGFDRAGNYTFGLAEQGVFLEIDPNKIDRARGMQITLVTSAVVRDQAIKLLEQLGLPLEKD